MDERTTSPAFENARVERANLRRSIGALEAALAAPAGRRTEEWSAQVRAAVVALQTSVETHIDTTERPDGILAEIVHLSPRLANSVARLRTDHEDFRRILAEEMGSFAAGAPDDTWVSERRERLTDLLSQLVRHRQRGADLTFEAYDLDIGGES